MYEVICSIYRASSLIDTLVETIDEQKKYLELENNLVTKLWDRTSRELFEKGYNLDMISEN